MKRKTSLFTLLIILSLLLIPGVVWGAEDWPSVYGNPAHTGYSPSQAPDTNNLAWESPAINANLSSSVVVVDGKVYVYCADGDMAGSSVSSIKCLSEADGSLLWTSPDLDPAQYGSWASPVYDNGKIFIGSGVTAYAIDAQDGGILWEKKLTLPVVNASPCVADGKVVFGDWDPAHNKQCYYYCFDQNTGDLKWKYLCTGDIQGTPAYADGKFYGTAWEYVGAHIYCINAETGAEIWHFDKNDGLTYDTCGAVSVADGKVFAATYNFYGEGELIALNAVNGKKLWGPVVIERTDSTPAYHDGKIYVTSGCVGYADLFTYCFDADTGDKLWTAEGVGNWTCSAAVADGKVFVGIPGAFFGYDGIVALNASDGKEVWSAGKGGATPAVANGKVFTIGSAGKVYAYGESSTTLTGDVNKDGRVDVQDMVLIGQNFGKTGDPGWIAADINKDGTVDVQDMVLIGQNWTS